MGTELLWLELESQTNWKFLLVLFKKGGVESNSHYKRLQEREFQESVPQQWETMEKFESQMISYFC